MAQREHGRNSLGYAEAGPPAKSLIALSLSHPRFHKREWQSAKLRALSFITSQ